MVAVAMRKNFFTLDLTIIAKWDKFETSSDHFLYILARQRVSNVHLFCLRETLSCEMMKTMDDCVSCVIFILSDNEF